jgi:hypothetical protein
MSFNPEYAPPEWSAQTFGDFNKGKPDVLHMAYDPRHDGSYALGDGKFFGEYDDAVAHQEKSVKATNNHLEARRKAMAKAEKLKAQKKAAREAAKAAPKEGFAQGGPVFDVHHQATKQGLSTRELATLVRVATGAPPEWAHGLAGHLMSGNEAFLRGHAAKYPKVAEVIGKVGAALAGKPTQKSASIDKGWIEDAIVASRNPSMHRALAAFHKGS